MSSPVAIWMFICVGRILAVVFKAPALFTRAGVASDSEQGDKNVSAQELADELIHALERVPEPFRFACDNEDILSRSGPPPPMSSLEPHAQSRLAHEDVVLLAQRCDLMITVYHTIMRLFIPKVSLAALAPPSSRQTLSAWSLNKGLDLTGSHISNLRAIESTDTTGNEYHRHSLVSHHRIPIRHKFFKVRTPFLSDETFHPEANATYGLAWRWSSIRNCHNQS